MLHKLVFENGFIDKVAKGIQYSYVSFWNISQCL